MTSPGLDRELLAVLVALEPLDDRKWDYLNLRERTFHSEQMLQEPWSSGERTLIHVAASLWNTGDVDLGYIACALGGRHVQAVLDATAIRAGRELTSNIDRALSRLGSPDRPRAIRETQTLTRASEPAPRTRTNDRPSQGRRR